MHKLLRGSTGTRLSREAYHADADERETASRGFDSWKLERRQHFREPWNASWLAFDRGEWDESLRLLDTGRQGLKEEVRQAAERDSRLLRVRVVEEPIAPYLQWELTGLVVSAECGQSIRVVGPEQVERFEVSGPLPELLTVGPDAVYEVVYDETGLADGAVRHIGATRRARVVEFIEDLYDHGEEIRHFHERKVAHLAPPRVV